MSLWVWQDLRVDHLAHVFPTGVVLLYSEWIWSPEHALFTNCYLVSFPGHIPMWPGNEATLKHWKYAYTNQRSAQQSVVSSPDPTSTLQEERGSGEYNIFVCPWNFGGTIWLADVAPVLGFLTTNHLASLITPLQTFLAHLPIYWSPARPSKPWLLAESIATASP